jgi:hypothetical protein
MKLKMLLFGVLILGVGCHSAQKQISGRELSESEALELAVRLANQECDKIYSVTPFEPSSYFIIFRQGRWHWGTLDLAGEGGLSAQVSFDARGRDPVVEVFLSVDTPAVYRPSN